MDVFSIVLGLAAVAAVVFAGVMAARLNREGEVDEERRERRFETVCGVMILGVLAALAWWLGWGGIAVLVGLVLLSRGGLVMVLARLWWLVVALGVVGWLLWWLV